MAIWTRARLMWEIENSPFSYYQKLREKIRKSHAERADYVLPLSDQEINELVSEDLKILDAVYFTYSAENKCVMAIPGHMTNQYGPGQFAFRCDFAARLEATNMYSMSFGLDVVLIPIDSPEEDENKPPVFTLADARCFQSIYEYMTSDTPPEHKRLPQALLVEMEAYRRYLSFEGYDTGTVSD